MQEILESLNSLVTENQILSTIAGGSVIVWLVTNIKSIFVKTVEAVTALISFSIVNTYEDARSMDGFMTSTQKLFNRFLSSSQVLWERTQNLDLSSPSLMRYAQRGGACESDRSNIDTLTYGFSIRIMFGKLVLVWRTIDRAQKITVTTTIRVFFASKRKFMLKLKEAIEDRLKADALSETKRNYIAVLNCETTSGMKLKRGMETIFTNNNEHYELLDSIRAFIDKKEHYEKLAYPYTYSALLYGEPGCGKTSTILAVASALNRDVMYVNLGKISMEKLLRTLNANPDEHIIVFEDIDALTTKVAASREAQNNDENSNALNQHHDLCDSLQGISLSDLLNITDGLLASDGTICLFTTNHIERLDPALIRSGRMNKLIRFNKLNRKTAARMIKANLGLDFPPSCFLMDEINPADLQACILDIALGQKSIESLTRKFMGI